MRGRPPKPDGPLTAAERNRHLFAWLAEYPKPVAYLRACHPGAYGMAADAGMGEDDILAECLLAVCQAARLYDPSRGARFATHAASWMRGQTANAAKRLNRFNLTASGRRVLSIDETDSGEPIAERVCRDDVDMVLLNELVEAVSDGSYREPDRHQGRGAKGEHRRQHRGGTGVGENGTGTTAYHGPAVGGHPAGRRRQDHPDGGRQMTTADERREEHLLACAPSVKVVNCRGCNDLLVSEETRQRYSVDTRGIKVVWVTKGGFSYCRPCMASLEETRCG